MPFAMNFYRDQVGRSGASDAHLPPAHRLVYIRHGSVFINGVPMQSDEGAYLHDAISIKSTGEWCEFWRWDIVDPPSPAMLLRGAGVFSSRRLSRIVSAIDLDAKGDWLFRLDRVASAPGRTSNPHRPLPGVRCLLEGTFNIHQHADSALGVLPGDAWWESGIDPVIAWNEPQIGALVVRGMIGPSELAGKPTGKWLTLDTPNSPGNWKLYADEIIHL